MTSNYRVCFGLKCEPFSNDSAPKDLLKLPGMMGVHVRMAYTHGLGGTMLVTGEVGSGKVSSQFPRWTAIRFS